MNNETRGMVLGFLGVTAFGLTLPATRIAVPYLDPVFIGLGRAVVAALVAGLLLTITRAPVPSMRELAKLGLVALGVVVGFPVLSAWAMQTVPASHGGVVLGILPLATAFAATLFSGDRPSKAFWAVGFIGSGLVVFYSLLQGGGQFLLGDIALLGAIVSAAIGYALGGELSKTLGGWRVICWALVLSLPFIALPAYLQMPVDPAAIPADIWIAFLYLALVSQLIGFFLWNQGLALGGVARVSQMQLIQPFVTIIASVLLVGEQLQSATVLFAVMVVIVVAVSKQMPVTQNPKVIE